MSCSEKARQKGILGIDAGGTFTDLVFWGEEDSRVLASAKTPTIQGDLVGTIERGLDLILKKAAPEQIKTFNLATTLATNAIVENKLRPCALMLIGYDNEMASRFIKGGAVNADYIYLVGGGHDTRGGEREPLDEAACRNACKEAFAHTDTIAISSYFSVRNPSHELRARDIAESERPGVFVSCGHELAAELDAVKRATTAALNAGLIPIIIDLLDSVEEVCRKRGINVPIMIVRGDGSLVSMEWARTHPVETVLSGPAASAIGACRLAGAENFSRGSCVVDIGGTTTDIIYLNEKGRPLLGRDGTTVGGHKTLVKSIDTFTFGLGGDSRISFSEERELVIGPRRVSSLCSAAAELPAVTKCLKDIIAFGGAREPLIVFRGERGRPEGSFEERVISLLEGGPSAADRLLENERFSNRGLLQLEDMERRGLLRFAAFTPTDALTALGRLDKWPAEASALGAEILAGSKEGAAALCAEVCERVSRIAAKNIFKKRSSSQGFDFDREAGAEALIDFILAQHGGAAHAARLKLNNEIIGVGAPSWAFIPRVGELLSETALHPAGAEVAGAVGAAVGAFFMSYAILITPLAAGGYRAHLPNGVKDFELLDEAVDDAAAEAVPWIKERAASSGAKNPIVSYRREDTEAEIAGGAMLYLSTHIYFDVSEGLEIA
ncbi:MAG: hydantoinase/oxoprolinase family protein [Synergistaceae bacterium]|nr:hydantoinase/oxoprolinase family protein [Synergistaceae bacterium]